jgi:MATE family multidrug resistance protein
MTAARTARASNDLLSGNPWAAIWRISWPLVLTMVFNALIGLMDTWIAGRIDPTSQAAVRLTMQLILLINATITAASIGCQALVSRFVGAEDWDEAAKAAQQSLLLGFWLSVAVLVPVFLFAPWFFQVMGATPAVQEAGAYYLRILLVGLLPMDIGILLNAIFRARGRTVALLVSNAAEATVWAAGSLVLGWYLGWGLLGLGIGFVLGKLAFVVSAWSLFRQTRLAKTIQGPWRLDGAWVRRVLDIGLPAGAQVLIRNFGMMAFFAILAKLAHPTESVAAFAIGFSVESLAFLPVFALNIATATLVGQNLGAGRPDEAEKAAWRIMGVSVAIMTAFGVAFWTLAEPLARLFTQDPLVVAIAVDYLRIAALSEPFLAITMVLNGALQGAGATRAPMLATLGAQIVLRLPAAYLLAVPLGWGASGAWWSMTGSMMIQSVIVVALFRQGGWRTKQV